MDATECEAGGQASLISWHSYIGIPINFHEESGISTFEAVNFTWLSSCQRHVRPIFEMKWRPRAFRRVSTGDSDILSSFDMNEEHS